MRIGELSRRTGVSVRMLRYYESEGLLAPRRTDAGHRDYGAAEAETVRRIRLLGGAGMTLATIRQLLPCVRSDHPAFEPCDALRRILDQQVGLLDQRIETLSRSRSILAGFLSSVGKPEGSTMNDATSSRPKSVRIAPSAPSPRRRKP